MVKFGIFEDGQLDVRTLQERLDLVGRRVLAWRDLLENLGGEHWIGVSHTDTDMLAVTIRLRFAAPVPLRRDALLVEVGPMLDRLHRLNLL